MKREEIKEAVKVMEAYADGKKVQINIISKWIDCYNPKFDWASFNYRIKPEPKYRPFKTMEECWYEMLKHQPFGWIRLDDMYINILCVHSVDKKIELSPEQLKFDDGVHVDIERMFISFKSAFNEYIFADGTPFGVKEE